MAIESNSDESTAPGPLKDLYTFIFLCLGNNQTITRSEGHCKDSDVTRLWQKQAMPAPKTALPALKNFKTSEKLKIQTFYSQSQNQLFKSYFSLEVLCSGAWKNGLAITIFKKMHACGELCPSGLAASSIRENAPSGDNC